MAEAFRAFGTTSMLPTVITDTPEIMRQAADAVAAARREGCSRDCSASISKVRFSIRAAPARIPPQFIRTITAQDIAWLASLDCGIVLLTIAPSHVTPETVRTLTQAGIIVSLGHSEATAQEAQRALAAGARGFTHLFNAMSQLQNREPGMVGAALADPSSYCGIIADGHHVHPLALQVALRQSRKAAFSW